MESTKHQRRMEDWQPPVRPECLVKASPRRAKRQRRSSDLDDSDVVLVKQMDGTQETGIVDNKCPDAEGLYDIRMERSGDIKKFKRDDIVEVTRKAASD